MEYFGWLRSVAERDGPAEVVLDQVVGELVKVEWLLATRVANTEGMSTMALMDRLTGRRDGSPVVAQIASQVEVVGRVRRDLEALDERYSREREGLVARLVDAEGKLDGRRRARIGECAGAWRAEVERLRGLIESADPEAVEARTVKVSLGLFAGHRHEQRVRPVQEWLKLELREAEATAERLEKAGREPVERVVEAWPGSGEPASTVTDGLDSAALERVVEGLEWPAGDG